ncbi:aspartic peptidase domain-containing protein, partial [Irpex lacteus]
MSSCLANSKYARSWKGKGRAIDPAGYRLVRRADASTTTRPAGEDGVVLPLTMIQASSYETIYTLPIQVGTSDQTQVLSVQVDSGSSDLWLASNSCGSSACKATGGNLYDPSHAKPTGQTFQIMYVEGEAVGPIVWDQVDIGGYTVDTQAVAAAYTVDDEPLSTDFNGVLGIALPANSVIASCVPPTTGNAPDGAVFASNLFSMTPASTAPSARFLSLSLARPEDNGGGTKSQLGIGKHPPELVSDPSQVEYDNLSNPANTVPYFWQAQLSSISVWVDGAEKVVDIGKSAKNLQSLPTAIIDSGMPVILTSRTVANALYGALGVGPGSDGQYYVSCTQPLNMTVTLDDRTAIPLHPLDLTVGAAGNCMGMIQAYPAGSTVADVGDVILGVPFMRSAYTVMAYDAPDAHGIFPNASQSRSVTHPRLGLLGLTDPSKALDEFHTVRVLNQPLTTGEDQSSGGGGGGSGTSSGGSTGKTETTGGKKLSVGLEVLIGIIGFFVLCFVLFAVRWAVHRRRLARMRKADGGEEGGEGGVRGSRGEYVMQQQAAMRLIRQSTMSSPYGLSEDTLRGSRGSKYGELKKVDSSSTTPRSDVESGYFEDTARTRIGD